MPAGTDCGSASAIARMPGLARSLALVIFRRESAGTTMTRVFERTLLRVPGSRSFFSSSTFIFSSSADRKRSAGAPSWICRASALEAARLRTMWSPPPFSYSAAISPRASVRLAAANTLSSAARTGAASRAVTSKSLIDNALMASSFPAGSEDHLETGQDLVLVVLTVDAQEQAADRESRLLPRRLGGAERLCNEKRRNGEPAADHDKDAEESSTHWLLPHQEMGGA